jgi:hypothetical protein
MIEVDRLEIRIFREYGKYEAEIKNLQDNTMDATQGDSYPEIIKRISEVILLRSEDNDK